MAVATELQGDADLSCSACCETPIRSDGLPCRSRILEFTKIILQILTIQRQLLLQEEAKYLQDLQTFFSKLPFPITRKEVKQLQIKSGRALYLYVHFLAARKTFHLQFVSFLQHVGPNLGDRESRQFRDVSVVFGAAAGGE